MLRHAHSSCDDGGGATNSANKPQKILAERLNEGDWRYSMLERPGINICENIIQAQEEPASVMSCSETDAKRDREQGTWWHVFRRVPIATVKLFPFLETMAYHHPVLAIPTSIIPQDNGLPSHRQHSLLDRRCVHK